MTTVESYSFLLMHLLSVSDQGVEESVSSDPDPELVWLGWLV